MDKNARFILMLMTMTVGMALTMAIIVKYLGQLKDFADMLP